MKKLLTLFAIILSVGVANAQTKLSTPIYGYIMYLYYADSELYFSDAIEIIDTNCGSDNTVETAKIAFEKYLISKYHLKASPDGSFGDSQFIFNKAYVGIFRSKEQALEEEKKIISVMKEDKTISKIIETTYTFTCNK